MKPSRLGLGTAAPSFDLRGVGGAPLTLEVRDGEPVVIAFLPAWPAAADDPSLSLVRAELRGLGATLVVLSDTGAWSFRPDDELLRVAREADMDAAELAKLRRAYGAPAESVSVFVVDGKGMLRFAHTAPSAIASPLATLTSALEAAGQAMVARAAEKACVRVSRRDVVVTSLVAALAMAFAEACKQKASPVLTSADAGATAVTTDASAETANEVDVTLDVNGTSRTLRIEPRVSLLDALRERMGLTGTKKGCDHGQCGACTVLVDGRRVNACLTLAIMAQGKPITTIEGLADGDALHPMQAAFIAEDGLQCGYCTPGQILSAVALLKEGRAHTDDEVREEMSGNLCRCGAQVNIVRAIQRARKEVRT